MELKLFAVSLRGRKAYKDEAGTLYLECTSCQSIKNHYNFTRDKKGFQGKNSGCLECRNELNKRYRMRAKG
ncbi:hypothetical protein P9E76_04915 [Schinkia azotoformans]|uniref:Uncharacterized protein n=1 Tax=Schinkia azotoformans LMG 9581 TaxID=1131731 RepID=K6DGF3_SCHAZ|nr:hypothetical protein [Schinkia azotoformans]EKN67394.1 hypothetical protein BAZO_09536 [Schinkia azotoformans LMG 9581]MEC1639353.1 hypothetical protein [Schinkia azotoformans]MEC1944393.1 hypothetical protein [Schinkia azotoformans]